MQSSRCGSAGRNLTSIREDADSTPDTAQWVKDLALPQAAVSVTNAAQIDERCCGCGCGPWLWSELMAGGASPSSWLPGESIVPRTAPFLFPPRQLDQTHLRGRRNRARRCAHTLSDLISAGSRAGLGSPSSPSLRMVCASWPSQPQEEMGFCAGTMCYQISPWASCLLCLFIQHRLERKGIFRNVL